MSKYYINPNVKKGHINKELHGNFSEHLGRCIYEGIYVGEDSEIPNVNGMRKDVVEALKKMELPVLRWPGGCFADEYHWKDGIGPKEQRKKMINTHWGGVIEDNSFGTHEFMELCKQIGCKAYICGNVGSGTVQEMSEWVEYMTFDGISPMAAKRAENGHKDSYTLDYFGVGNENWGCGGCMTAEYYANEYRRYQTYVRNYSPEKKVQKIACGPNSDDYEWTETLMKIAGRFMDGLSLHYYTVPDNWAKKGSAVSFDEECYYRTLRKTLHMEELLTKHGSIMDKYDSDKKIGLIVDEWGTWFDVEEGTNPGFLYQQNTMRDAMVAAINLNLFQKHCDRVKMANIAQLVNVLQSVILTEGEKMVLTPTYHVFDMYKQHREGELIDSNLCIKQIGTENEKIPNLSECVSIKDGKIFITMANLDLHNSYDMEAEMVDFPVTKCHSSILTGEMNAHNTFTESEQVKPEVYEGVKLVDGKVSISIPPCSILAITLE